MPVPGISPVSLTMPTDYAAEQADIIRRQKLAEMMQQQSMQPLESGSSQGPLGSVTAPLSWTQGLAKLMQGYAGNKAYGDTLTRQQALASRIRGEAQQQMSSMPQGTPGTPEQYTGEPGTVDELYKPAQAATQPTREQMQAWAMNLAGSGNPISSPMGMKVAEEYLKPVTQDTLAKNANALLMHQTPSGSTIYSQGQENARFGGVSGNTQATLAQAKQLHDLDRSTLSASDQAHLNVSLAHLGIAKQTLDEGRVQLMTDDSGNVVAVNKMTKQTVPVMSPGGGPLKGKEANITETQGKANLYQSRARESANVIDQMSGQYSPAAVAGKQALGKVWGVGGALEAGANVLLPKNAQQVEQAQRNFVNAILRQESGSAIAESEFQNAQKQYFPQPGDSPVVINQKKQNRETAISGLQVMAGPAMKRRASDKPGATIDFNQLPP